MTEETAINLCLKHRDPAGFESLFRQYRKEAYFHASSLMGNPEEAADACQEAFRRAFAAMPGLRKLDNFYPWFYRILRNYCLNQLARRRTSETYRRNVETDWTSVFRGRKPMARSEEAAADSPEAGRSMGQVCVSPDFIALQNEEHALVWEALQQLEPDHREILAMKYFEDRPYSMISEILGIPRGTVMSRLYAARKALRERLLERGLMEYHAQPDTTPR